MKKLTFIVLILLVQPVLGYSNDSDLLKQKECTSDNGYFQNRCKSFRIVNLRLYYNPGYNYEKFTKNRCYFKSCPNVFFQPKEGIESMFDLDRNALILATDFIFSISLSYERLTPINEYFGFLLRGGTGITFESGDELVLIAHPGFLVGKRRHFLETGLGYYQTFNFDPSFIPLIGYRYMGYKGFLFKAYGKLAYYTDDEWIDEWGHYEYGFGIVLGYRFGLQKLKRAAIVN